MNYSVTAKVTGAVQISAFAYLYFERKNTTFFSFSAKYEVQLCEMTAKHAM